MLMEEEERDRAGGNVTGICRLPRTSTARGSDTPHGWFAAPLAPLSVISLVIAVQSIFSSDATQVTRNTAAGSALIGYQCSHSRSVMLCAPRRERPTPFCLAAL